MFVSFADETLRCYVISSVYIPYYISEITVNPNSDTFAPRISSEIT